MNRLHKERSPYLRHAAEQKIDWYPWSDEAFQRAADEDKPVFLSTGAVWCHWCHVMAKECFEDDEISRMLNEGFICVKLDRDEHPDIDRRYQQAVVAIASTGGWPLSVFLTPERKPFFGGTYFPPEDSHGRPGFRKVLSAVLDFYRTKRGEVSQYADDLVKHLSSRPAETAEPGPDMLDKALSVVLAEVDSVNGGFGSFPKFPMPAAMEFLMNRYALTADGRARDAVVRGLYAMARGGFHDQLQGGFHRYSVDEAWLVPHFEKMADDNAWLLRNYIGAYWLFRDEYFREVAEGIIRFSREVLSDPAGGFYASQDADVTPDDEGGYFTWTEQDFRQVLGDEEYRVAHDYFFLPRGKMHHDASKNVLGIARDPGDIAADTGTGPENVAGIITAAKSKLLEARKLRETPFIDKTLYTSLNGLFITAYLTAYRVTGDEGVKAFALLTLERLLGEMLVDGELYHTTGVKGLLDDYVYLVEALLAAYEVSGERTYGEKAESVMSSCMERLWDRDSGGFFDAAEGLLGIALKPMEDIPHPSANSVAIRLLLKLGSVTGKGHYYTYAEEALKAFATAAGATGIHAAAYFCSLDAWSNRTGITVCAGPEGDLAKAALLTLFPFSSITYAEDKGFVIPCFGTVCHEPVYDAGELTRILKTRGTG